MRGIGLSLVMVLAATAGCVERTISITSTPSGALVHLNDEEVGRTPLTVPFKFYGVYDVRLTREGEWFTTEQTQELLGFTADQLRDALVLGALPSEEVDGRTMVFLNFAPKWTKREAAAPWWEHPGPDLFAEAIPGKRVQLDWHFHLQPRPRVDEDDLIARARQMQALTEQTPSTPAATDE